MRTSSLIMAATTVLLVGSQTGQTTTEKPNLGSAESNDFHRSAPINHLEQPALPSPELTLTGITTISGDKKALLKVELPSSSPGQARVESLILGEHQGSGQVEVLEIDHEAGSVKVRNSGVVTLLALSKDGPRAAAEAGPALPRLSGLINLPEMKLVLLVSTSPSKTVRQYILAEGQREENIELIEIQPQRGVARLHLYGMNSDVVVTNTALQIEGAGSGLALENAELRSILWLLGELSQRTILHPVVEVGPTGLLKVAGTNKLDAAKMLCEFLQTKGLSAIDDGHRFVMVAPEKLIATANPRSSQIKSTEELMPAGVINFPLTPIRLVVPIYAELKNCKLEESPASRSEQPIEFKNQTPLTKEECLYALDTVLGWAGVKVIPRGDGRIEVVQVASAER